MREDVIQKIKRSFDNASESHDKESYGYLVSMSFFAAALIKDQDLFNRILPLFSDHLKSSVQDHKTPWLYGRLLLSIQTMNESDDSISNIQKTIKEQLESDNTIDNQAIYNWAWAYFAASFSDNQSTEYQQAKEKMLESLDQQIKDKDHDTNLMWSFTMMALAAGNNQDIDLYRLLYSSYIKKISGGTSIQTSVNLVPLSDYRGWLITNLRYAARKMGDQDRFEKLLPELQKVVKANEVENDVMLANATEFYIGKAM